MPRPGHSSARRILNHVSFALSLFLCPSHTWLHRPHSRRVAPNILALWGILMRVFEAGSASSSMLPISVKALVSFDFSRREVGYTGSCEESRDSVIALPTR